MSLMSRLPIVALALAAPLALAAQPIKSTAKLRAEAKLSGDSAKKIALAQVPNGKIQSGELESEKGKLLYSFDIKVAGKSGVEEVNVDANSGAVLAHEHETAKAEHAEARKEAAEKKAAAKKP